MPASDAASSRGQLRRQCCGAERRRMPDHSRAVRPIEDDARGRRAMGTSIAGYRLFAPRALLVPAKPWLRIKAPWATGAAGVTGKPADGSYAVAAKTASCIQQSPPASTVREQRRDRRGSRPHGVLPTSVLHDSTGTRCRCFQRQQPRDSVWAGDALDRVIYTRLCSAAIGGTCMRGCRYRRRRPEGC